MQMEKLTAHERRTRCFASMFFIIGCAIVGVLQFTIGLLFTPHYFVAHFLLGLFLPYLFYAVGAGTRFGFWAGMLATAVFHFGYELWEDQKTRSFYSPDWDQIGAGAVGLFFAWLIYVAWNRRTAT